MVYVWCTCSQCRLSEGGRLQQSRQTAALHARQDERDELYRCREAARIEQEQVNSRYEFQSVRGRSPTESLDGERDAYRSPGSSHTLSPRRATSPAYSLDEEVALPRGAADRECGPETDSESEPEPDQQVANEEDEPIDLTSDPLYATRSSLFEHHRAGEGQDDDNVDELLPMPTAFEEHPAIRNLYVRAFIAANFHGATHEAVKLMLNGTMVTLKSVASVAPELEIEGLETMARTLYTAEKRLGICTDTFITYFVSCTHCWRLYRPSTLYRLSTPDCAKAGCSGKLYSTKRTLDGTEKRTPLKIVPYVPPKKAIQRMLLRPGKWLQLQSWRGPDDVAGQVPPFTSQGFDAFPDPSRPLHDIHDGWGWRAVQAGLERRKGGPWTVEDVDVHELHQRFVALPCGLLWQINIDWFQSIKATCHLTGALYMVCLNNPRSVRYLREETILVLIIPGPSEPTQEGLNEIVTPFVQDMLELGDGFSFRVEGLRDPQVSHSQVQHNVSDLPASRKLHGLASHSSKLFMCPTCDTPFFQLIEARCYDPERLNYREDWRYIKYAFRAAEVDPVLAEEIFSKRGIRYSVMNRLPGWLPARCSVVDFMHCIFLCIIKNLCRNILYKNGMLNPISRDHNPLRRWEDFHRNLVWPVSVGRLPASVISGGSVKADQWRSQIAVLFLALFVAWEADGDIPDLSAPSSAPSTNNAKAQASMEKLLRSRRLEALFASNPSPSMEEIRKAQHAVMDRSLRKHYDIILEFSAAVRILTTHSISPNDIKRGCGALTRSMQNWACMGCHMTPYYHFAVHIEQQMYWLGPMYSHWTMPFERNNGFLGHFNHNGHGGGELEGTMMRGWWKTILIQDLVAQFEAIPDPSSEDQDSLNLLKAQLKAGTRSRNGTLQDYLSRMDVSTNSAVVEFPRSRRRLQLRNLDSSLYNKVFRYLRALWMQDTTLLSDVSSAAGSHFMGDVDSYSRVLISRTRYGAATSLRGQSAKFAYIHGRVPVQIEYLLTVAQKLDGGRILTAHAAVVRRFVPSMDLSTMPWDLWASDLGVDYWHADQLADLEVVELGALSGHFILSPVTIRDIKAWITISYNHENPECDATELCDEDDNLPDEFD